MGSKALYAMGTSSFKLYRPGFPTYAPRISDEEWDSHKDLLYELNLQGLSRTTMLETLAGRGFHPSRGQLNARLQRWNFDSRTKTASQPDESYDAERVGVELDSGEANAAHPYRVIAVPETSSILSESFASSEEAGRSTIQRSDNEMRSSPKPLTNQHSLELPNETSQGTYSLTILSNIYTGFQTQVSAPFARAGTPFDLLQRAETFLSDSQSYHRKQILPNIQLSQHGFWRQLLPVRCCCRTFFSMREQNQRFLSDVYWKLLERHEASTTLGRAMAILYICETQTTFTPVQDMLLRDTVRALAKHYTLLANRSGIKNACVSDLYYSIATVYAALFEESTPVDIGWPRAYKIPKIRSTSFYQTAWTLEVRLSNELILPPTRFPEFSYPWTNWPSLSQEEQRTFVLRNLQICHSFLACHTEILYKYLTNLSLSPIDPDASVEDFIGLVDESSIPNIAAYLSEYLLPIVRQANVELELTSTAAPEIVLQDLAAGFSLLVARRLQLLFGYDKAWHYYSIFTIRAAVIASVSVLSDDLISGLCFTQDCPDTPENSDLVEAIWMCRSSEHFLSGKHLVPHLGYCEHLNISRTLQRPVTDWDKKMSWAERKIQRATRSLPQISSLPTDDALSIISSSSDNSFNRLRAFALRISMQEDPNRNSTCSEWSGHMSEDDWGLDDIMEVDEPLIGTAI